jgi:hypothetical protein
MEEWKQFIIYLYHIRVLRDRSLYERLRILEQCRDITSNPEKKSYFDEKLHTVLWHYLMKIRSRI